MSEKEVSKIFYLHIPKTGGQTLATRLASAFDLDSVHLMADTLRFPQDVEKLSQLLREKRFIESHVAGRLLRDFSDRPILCTVREPVAQMLSSWRHIRRETTNRFHRAARTLRPRDFFDLFEDHFINRQTNYLQSALFEPMRQFIEREGYHRAVYSRLMSCVDRLRWLVPTESIDEFVDLWALETKRSVPNRRATINVAPVEKELDLDEAR